MCSSDLVYDLLEFQNHKALVERAKDRWLLSEEQASNLSFIRLEQGYARFSRRALERLVPRMEEGLPYMTAARDEFEGKFTPKKPLDSLPPFEDVLIASRRADFYSALNELPIQRAQKTAEAIERKRQGVKQKFKPRTPSALRNPAVCRSLTEIGRAHV